jgi:hypothetical protein
VGGLRSAGGVMGYGVAEDWGVVEMGCCMDESWPEEMGKATPRELLGGGGGVRVSGWVMVLLGVVGLFGNALLGVVGVACL